MGGCKHNFIGGGYEESCCMRCGVTISSWQQKRIEELEARNDQLYQDRYDALSVTSKDGLLSSEWILRTGQAERKAKELEAKHAALVDELQQHIRSWDDHSSTYTERAVVNSFRAIIKKHGGKDDE